MSSSVGAQDVNLQKLRGDAMRGKWSEVFETCKQNRALYTAKITGTGDTVLHMAVSNGQEKLVANMLDFLVLEEKSLTQNNVLIPVDGDEVESWSENVVLGADNDRNNTPLHLAAVKGNVEMCKKIGERDPSLIVRRNIAGETPLFLAALYGWKEAFLWLHYLYMEGPGVLATDLAHCIRDDNDTILHCAIAEGHFDVAIEVVHLYKDHLKEMMRPNKEGLSPLHLLAAKPSAFKTTALLERSFIERSFLVHPIYGSLKVEEKNQATTHEELQKKNQENSLVKLIKFINSLLPFVLLFLLLVFFAPEDNIVTLFLILAVLLRFVQSALGIWLPRIRKEKEKHTRSLQIMNELLYHSSNEDMSEIISRTSSEQLSISLQREEFNESEAMATPLSGRITIDTPLLIAAKNGVVEMVERILEIFPSRIKDVNAEGKNIVLLAVEYRQTEVFKFLCKQSQSLFGQVDKEGNNALHLATSLRVDIDWHNPGKTNWFEFVKKSMPRGLSERYNRKMETPEDIFRERHKELMKSNGEWAAKTSQACSVVSTLVASVAYATCTNVPGDYDDKGYAIHRNKPPVFKIFEACSFVALLFSVISTILFLSIVASPSQSVYSWRYVPVKLCSGVYFMFFSIVCLCLSFCAGNFFMLDDKSKNLDNLLLLYIVVSSGIILLVLAQIPIFFGKPFFSLLRTTIPRRNAIRPIEYQRTKSKENGTDLSHQN